ncbi:MAG: hypothetical protein JNL84_09340 [Candidatus Accumulibacter sp.]|nr:hypothetical protein [Accumulibacter sp.]
MGIRRRVTLKMLIYALFDALGMLIFASGAMWLFWQRPLLINGFPDSAPMALLAVVCGGALMVWSVAGILRELIVTPDHDR